MRIKKILRGWIVCIGITLLSVIFLFSPFDYSEKELNNEISQINNSFEKITKDKLLPSACNLSIDCCKSRSKRTYIKFNNNKSSEDSIQYFVSKFYKDKEEFELFYNDDFAEIVILDYFTFECDLLKPTEYLNSYNLNYDKDKDYVYFETSLAPTQRLEVEITDYSKENYKINLKHFDERERILYLTILIFIIETVIYFIICCTWIFLNTIRKR